MPITPISFLYYLYCYLFSPKLIIMKKAALLFITTIGTLISFSQNVGISNVPITPDPSSLLEVRSTTKGVLIPRMNTVQMGLIIAPIQGLMIYNTDTKSFFYYDIAWKEMAIKDDNVWVKNGNEIYNSNTGFVGVGTNTPFAKLDVVTASTGVIAKFSGGTQTWMEFRENNVYRGYLGSFAGNPEDMDFGANTGGKIHFTIGASPKVTISTSGFLGVGKTAPGAPLDILSTSTSNVANFDGSTSMYIGLYENSVYRGYLGSFSGAATDVDFGTGAGNSTGKLNFTIQATPKFSIAADGTAQVLGTNLLELGGGVAGKETNAGKIGYNAFGQSGLTFTGAGTTISNRAVFFYAEGGTTTNGPIYLEKAGGGSPTIEIKPTETGVDGSEILLHNGAGLVTIELDADFGDGDGRVITSELQIKGGSDLAEHFDINVDEEADAKPGMLVSIDTKTEGKLCLTNQAGDTKIVGVISGANGIKPGMLMGQEGTLAFGKYPIALAGRVYVLATNEAGEIQAGDFLTSSAKKGYAKKVTNINKNQGAIIGKAMGKVNPGNGYVLVLINLQ